MWTDSNLRVNIRPFAILILIEDFKLTPRQAAEIMGMDIGSIYYIKNKYGLQHVTPKIFTSKRRKQKA
jgi:hypothetical protein